MKPTRVGTRELKNRLSQYLRRVKAGETVVITEHGKPVGQIVPVTIDLADRLKTLVHAGVIEWNGQTLKSHKPNAINKSNHLLSDLIREDRQ